MNALISLKPATKPCKTTQRRKKTLSAAVSVALSQTPPSLRGQGHAVNESRGVPVYSPVLLVFTAPVPKGIAV